jgi:hypothetical protein
MARQHAAGISLSPGLAPDRHDRGRRERFVDGGSDDGARDEEDGEDSNETSDGQQGVQGSHDRHSRVLRGTLYGQTAAASPAFLRPYTFPVDNLNAT